MIMEKIVSPIIVEIHGQNKNVYVRVTYGHGKILDMSVSPMITQKNLDMSVSPMIMKQFFGVNAKAQASANFK